MKKIFSFFLIILIMLISPFEVWSFQQKWEFYKKNFISHDGRVIDFQNNSISHSEGQAYGMLLSLMFNDMETFEKIREWTRNNLKIRTTDKLLAWSWGKHISGKWTILDYNNASDGDLIYAYCLLIAYKNWKKQEHLDEAKEIIKDIKELLIAKDRNKLYLLPGYYGFDKDNLIEINPSYYFFPAFKAFSEIDDRDFWNKFNEDSLGFLIGLNFGSLNIPTDWISLKDGKGFILKEKEEIFGIEAIRIILYAAMTNEKAILSKFMDYLSFIEKVGYVPFMINLKKNEASLNEGLAFQYFIASLLAEKIGKKELSERLKEIGRKKLEEEGLNYYSYTLSLISMGVK